MKKVQKLLRIRGYIFRLGVESKAVDHRDARLWRDSDEHSKKGMRYTDGKELNVRKKAIKGM